jgi:hypothetical protein
MIVSQITSPIMVIANIVATCATFGTAAAGTMSARAGVKVAQIADKLAKLGKVGRLVNKFGNALAEGIAQVGKLKKWGKKAEKAVDYATMASDFKQSVQDMVNQFNDMKTMMKTQDVLSIYAGSYVGAQAAANLQGGLNGSAYKALTLFFMAELSYVQAKEQTQVNAGMKGRESECVRIALERAPTVPFHHRTTYC